MVFIIVADWVFWEGGKGGEEGGGCLYVLDIPVVFIIVIIIIITVLFCCIYSLCVVY